MYKLLAKYEYVVVLARVPGITFPVAPTRDDAPVRARTAREFVLRTFFCVRDATFLELVFTLRVEFVGRDATERVPTPRETTVLSPVCADVDWATVERDTVERETVRPVVRLS